MNKQPISTLAFLPTSSPRMHAAHIIRAVFFISLIIIWEIMARSGLLLRDVVPSLLSIAQSLLTVLSTPLFYSNLQVTAFEVFMALAIGSALGIMCGIIIGSNAFLSAAFEPYLYYMSPTPRIIFFPVMIMWFGVGSPSKIALGALSCFFTIALSTADGMRQIDKVLIRVGRSFRANALQMAFKIYLPAMRAPVLNGLRLGFGTAVITALLAETKLSNQGLGFMIMQIYSRFDMPTLYALLIIVFILAGIGNAFLSYIANEQR
jgi:NitT/TauT family transport system permease protein